jgi:hypothetical protein
VRVDVSACEGADARQAAGTPNSTRSSRNREGTIGRLAALRVCMRAESTLSPGPLAARRTFAAYFSISLHLNMGEL